MSNKPYYWLYGKHSVEAAMKNSNREIKQFLLRKSNANLLSQYEAMIKKRNIECGVIENAVFDKKVGHNVSHQGVAIFTRVLDQPILSDILLEQAKTIVMLDQVTDPQNIGAIIRTSAAFGVAAIITGKDCSPAENGSLVKTAVGTFEKMPYVQVTNLRQTINQLKQNNFWSISVDKKGGNSVDIIRTFEKILLIFGSEDRGIRAINIKASDLSLGIDISCDAESLNVSNAVAICLHASYCKNN